MNDRDETGNRHFDAPIDKGRVWESAKTCYKYVFVLSVGIIFGWMRSNYWTHRILENSAIAPPVKMTPDYYYLALVPGFFFGIRRVIVLYRELKESVTLVRMAKLAGWVLLTLALLLNVLIFVADGIGVIYRAFR